MAEYGMQKQINVGGFSRILSTILVLVLLFFMGACSITKVDTGNVGVLTKFGRVTGDVLPEGIHLIDPLKSSNELSVRTQEQKETAAVPSSEGLIMTLEASLLFHLDKEKAADVYQKLGPDYRAKIVEPTMRSAMREATSSHGANALYTGEREQVAKEIESNLASQLSVRGIVVEKVLLRDIQLPESLKRSIELKQAAEQESLAMQFAQAGGDKFAGVTLHEGLNGVPLISGCVVYFECVVEARYPGGDHDVIVGRVRRIFNIGKTPLLFHVGALRTLG